MHEWGMIGIIALSATALFLTDLVTNKMNIQMAGIVMLVTGTVVLGICTDNKDIAIVTLISFAYIQMLNIAKAIVEIRKRIWRGE